MCGGEICLGEGADCDAMGHRLGGRRRFLQRCDALVMLAIRQKEGAFDSCHSRVAGATTTRSSCTDVKETHNPPYTPFPMGDLENNIKK